MQKRQNLWRSLGLLAVAGLLFRLSFSVLNHLLAIIIGTRRDQSTSLRGQSSARKNTVFYTVKIPVLKYLH